MDVRCERCKTEYEFDDARITEAGVTVKCTTCGHVFKVKKKALFVTVPVKPDDASTAGAAPLTGISTPGDAKEKPKEWKVRQSTGNVFTFKELTTLQKWIVERKVTREDEISLTGETWKRLGNIAELASFFQVVDDAQKAVQLGALQNLGLQMTPGTGYPIPAGAPAAPTNPPPPAAAPLPSAQPPQTSPSFPAVSAAPPAAGPAQVTHFPASGAPTPATVTAGPAPVTPPEPPTPAVSSPPPAAERAPVAEARPPNHSIPPPQPYATLSAERAESRKKGGGLGWLIPLVLLGAVGGGGYWAYTQGLLPFVDELLGRTALNERPPTVVIAPAPAESEDAGQVEAGMNSAGETDAGALADATVDAGEAAALAVVDAGSPDAGTATASAAADAGTITASAPRKPEPVRDFDWYMEQGDRLRDRDRAEAALDMYGKAGDLQPTRAEPFAGRGMALLDMGAPIPAEASFQQAIKLNPRYGVAVMGLAEAYRIQGKNAEAVKSYRRYLEISPNGSEANVARNQIERLSK